MFEFRHVTPNVVQLANLREALELHFEDQLGAELPASPMIAPIDIELDARPG